MPDGIDASQQMVANWNKQVQEQAARYQAMANRVEELSVTEKSPDGAVTVTVSAKGLLTNLSIAESAQGKRMAEVSAQVMSTVQRAQSRIPQLLQQAMAETVGTEDAAANKVLDDAGRTFPEPPQDETPGPDNELSFTPEADEPTPPPRPKAPPPPAPPSVPPPGPGTAPRRRPRRDDDDDDFGGSILS